VTTTELEWILLKPEDREHLKNYGVSDAQLKELDLALADLDQVEPSEPPMKEMRDSLTDLLKGVEQTQRALRKLMERRTSASKAAARLLIQTGDPEWDSVLVPGKRLKEFEPQAFLQELDYLQFDLENSLDSLPPGQTRRRVDTRLPAKVNLALQLGAGILKRDWDSEHPWHRPRHRTPSDYRFRVAQSRTSPFFYVVSICHQITTGRAEDQERAIRAYVRQLKQSAPIHAAWDELWRNSSLDDSLEE
jgi:hypothetical protein